MIDFRPAKAAKRKADADLIVETPQGRVYVDFKSWPRPFAVGASSILGSYPGSAPLCSEDAVLSDRVALYSDWTLVAGDLWTAVDKVNREIPGQERLFDAAEYDRSRK
jgi:hypothetical protein